MIEIIPAIDIIGGKCVRLSQGDYASKQEYNQDPVEMALQLEAYGIQRLHVVDLDGAASQHVVNYRVLERIAGRTSLKIDFGGGIKTDEDLVIAFDNGAQMVTLGSVAVKHPERFDKWLAQYGPEKIILGADVKNGKIAVNGWKEESNDQLEPFIDAYIKKGVTQVLCTDISRDGMMQGPATDLYHDIISQHPTLHLIASGGVSCIDDIRRLEEKQIPAVVFGKALYEGRITLKQLADVDRLLNAGADKISINSAALKNPALIDDIARHFGSQVCVVAIDARQTPAGWKCYLNGGRLETDRYLYEWAQEANQRGAGEILFTSMDHDGVKTGYANEALAHLAQTLSIPVIASGGAGAKEHFRDAFLLGKADAALAASVFHFGEIPIPSLKEYLREEGINVRL